MNHCHALEELPGVENMRSLEQLSAINCYRLRWWGEAEEKLKSRLQGAFTSGFQPLLEPFGKVNSRLQGAEESSTF